ncbi:unnamed protein product [Cylicostephanus goldi]|uniref:Uncharacterized protein n=1 Tax=Cylicostephanus goldi TaxID=71465 RepID=A0A3P6V1S8_CYLGO|nr:unnamed protein product [Cylicostephanus goldi]
MLDAVDFGSVEAAVISKIMALINGALRPLDAGKFIVEHGKLIKINEDGVQRVAKMIYDAAKDGTIAEVQFSAHAVHPTGKGKAVVDW